MFALGAALCAVAALLAIPASPLFATMKFLALGVAGVAIWFMQLRSLFAEKDEPEIKKKDKKINNETKTEEPANNPERPTIKFPALATEMSSPIDLDDEIKDDNDWDIIIPIIFLLRGEHEKVKGNPIGTWDPE